MKEHFDLIALPKGQAPGAPVQASDGTWYIVIPAMIDMAAAFDLIEGQRAGRPVTDDERKKALDWLTKKPGKEVE